MVYVVDRLLRLSPASCVSVQLSVLPALVHILQASKNNVAVSGTVTCALDMLKHVLLAVEAHTRDLRGPAAAAASAAAPSSPSTVPSAAPELLSPLLFSELLPLTLTLLMRTDDGDLIEIGMKVLSAYLRVDAQRVQACVLPPVLLPGAPARSAPTANVGGLQALCVLVQTFLQPSLDDMTAHNVGSLVVQLVFSCGAVLGDQNVQQIVNAGQSFMRILFCNFSTFVLFFCFRHGMMNTLFNHLSIELQTTDPEL